MSAWSRLKRGFRQAGSRAVTGAVTLPVFWHWYTIYTDSPALRDGHYPMFPLITAPPGGLIGGIIGFVAGVVSGDKESAPQS